MKTNLFKSIFIATVLALISCSEKTIEFDQNNLEIVNRDLISINTSSLKLDNKEGDGLAILKTVNFDTGSIEVELKGENTPGRSFVGIAFNIQNDSTYEAVYFRPFNFQSTEKIRREHAVQYISHPKNSWHFLRTNFEGQYEAEFPRQPSPDDWFEIEVKITPDQIFVFDKQTNLEILNVKRLETQKSNKIGLWTGNNSKGEFRNLTIIK